MLLQGCILVALVGLGYAYEAGLLDAEAPTLGISYLATSISIWNFYSWRLVGGRLFDPYALFLLAASLFNAGQAYLECFQLNENGILNGRVSGELVVQSLYLVVLGISSMHLGALAAFLHKSARPSFRDRCRYDFSPYRLKPVRDIGFLSIGVALVPFVLLLRYALTIGFAEGYRGLYGRDISQQLHPLILNLAAFIVPGIMFMVAGSGKSKAILAFAASITFAYAGTMLFAGSRGSAIMSICAFLWIYDRSVQKIPRARVAAVGVSMLALIAVVGSVRNISGARQDLGLALDAISKVRNPLIAPISEMGGTLLTVSDTIQLFPDVRPFDHGISYAFAVSTILPNIGWNVHPAISHGLLADWLIRTVDPSSANVGGGLGYSFLAELFANYGWFGLIPSSALLGYLLNRLFIWGTQDSDPAKMALVATFLASFLLFARGESGSFVRPLVWYSFLPYFGVRLITGRPLFLHRGRAISHV